MCDYDNYIINLDLICLKKLHYYLFHLIESMAEHVDYMLLFNSFESILYFCLCHFTFQVNQHLISNSRYIVFKYWKEVLHWGILRYVWGRNNTTSNLLFICSIAVRDLWIAALSMINTSLWFLSYLCDLMNLIMSLKKSTSLSEFIVELCKWLKCQPVEEIQEIIEIEERNIIDFSSTFVPLSHSKISEF